MDQMQIYSETFDKFANLYEINNDSNGRQKVIGEGGFGKVYDGLSKKTGDSVAIKVVKKKKLSDSELAREFPKELEFLREVQDVSGVIGLVDYFDMYKQYVYVMEKPNGCIDLDTFVDNYYKKYKKVGLPVDNEPISNLH